MIFYFSNFLLISVLPVVLSMHELAVGCGQKGKHCITRPPDCLPDPKLCTQIATITTVGHGLVQIHIKAKGSRLKNRWVGVGFSEDDSMGKDAVVMCFQNETMTVAELSYNSDHFNVGSTGVDQKYIHPSESVGEDDSIHCSLHLHKKFTVREQEFDLAKPHYLLFSSGPTKAGRIGKHDKTPIVSTDPYIFP